MIKNKTANDRGGVRSFDTKNGHEIKTIKKTVVAWCPALIVDYMSLT